MAINNTHKTLVAFFALMFVSFSAFAHSVNYALEKSPTQDVIFYYLKLGVAHIVPYGIDHILFVVALCLLNSKLKTILWQATAFTAAHSITLALSMKNVIALPSEIVEPIIALSIVFVAVENILLNELKAWRILVVFLFGLIHGLGFAASLNEIGLPANRFIMSIVSFNIGVEIGQALIVLVTYLLVLQRFGRDDKYRRRIVIPASAIIGGIACYWTIERLFSY